MLRDPGRVNLRKASRAAIAVPGVFAIAVVGLDDATMALFSAFASFAALVFCDFGGSMRGRARAYAGLLVVGAGLVALGTVLSRTTVAAVIAMLVVGFVIVFAGSLGGYVAAGGSATVLSFVLAVMVPATNDELAARELGWVVGVGIGAIAALVLWPVQERRRVRDASATLGDAMAAVVDPDRAGDPAAVPEASRALRAETGAILRPAGNAARDRALVSLVRQLHLAEQFVGHLLPDGSAEYGALRRATASTLRVIAAALREPVAIIDVAPLVRARRAHTARLETWASRPDDESATDAGRAMVSRFDDEFPARALSLRVLAAAIDVAANSGAQLAGLDPVPEDTPGELAFVDLPSTRASVGRTLAEHADFRSVRLRGALRTGIGLAIAVAVAKAFELDHAFWVVLGTLSVLRSNALGTGVTAFQAVLGAAIGFAVVGGGIVVIGGDEAVLWVVLPIAVFLSAYTPGAVHFVVGQASFTVFVVVLFNLIEPEGWQTGLVRVEDIAIGVGISLFVGVLAWPRGARAVAVTTFTQMLHAGVRFVERALAALLDGGTGRDAATERAGTLAVRARAIAALEDLSVERGGGHVDREAWVGLLGVASSLLLAGEGLMRLGARPPVQGCRRARGELAATGATIEQTVDLLARRLADPSVPEPVPGDRPATDGLCDCVEEQMAAGAGVPITLLWARELLALVEQRASTVPVEIPA